MKLIATTLLAVCLFQATLGALPLSGLATQLSGRFSNAASAVTNTARSGVSQATGLASGIGASITSSLPAAAQGLLGSQQSEAQLAQTAQKLSVDDSLSTINSIATDVQSRVEALRTMLLALPDQIDNITLTTMQRITSSWDAPVQAAVDRAQAAGVDLSECPTDSVRNVADSASLEASRCATNKLRQVFKLTENVMDLPNRATQVAEKGSTAVQGLQQSCPKSENSGLIASLASGGLCRVKVIAPIVIESARLFTDTVKYGAEASLLVSTLQADLSTCVSRVATSKAAEATLRSTQTLACIAKQTAASRLQ